MSQASSVLIEAGDCKGPNLPFEVMEHTSKPLFSNFNCELSERRCNYMDKRLLMINIEVNPTSGNISLLLTLRASPTLQTVASMASIT